MQSHPYTIVDGDSSFTVRVLHTRNLGKAQISCGSLMIVLGLLPFLYPQLNVGLVLHVTMACGIWVVVGGILGVCSAVFTSSTSLNWGNMAFAIVSACGTILELVIYILAIVEEQSCDLPYSYSHNCSNYRSSQIPIALFVPLVVLSIAQFGISITVIIYCRKYGCSWRCCGEANGMVTQQPGTVPSSVEMQTCTHSSGQAGYPAASYPVATYPVASCPHAFESSAQPVFAGHQQGAHTGTGVAATVQPVVVGYIPIVPQSSQFAQLPMQ